MSISPAVGSVIRLRILRRVLLPAPLRPIRPTTSPLLTSKLTSLRAENRSRGWGAKRRARREARDAWPSTFGSDVSVALWNISYTLEIFRIEMARSGVMDRRFPDSGDA